MIRIYTRRPVRLHCTMIYGENDLYNSGGASRPNGDAFYHTTAKCWKTLWGARNWIDSHIHKWADFRRNITSGETQIEPSIWERMGPSSAWSSWGRSIRTDGKQILCLIYMPSDTRNVVTFRRPIESLEAADQQLDYVFASRGFHESVTVRALNSVEEWGASDHCRLLIEVAG